MGMKKKGQARRDYRRGLPCTVRESPKLVALDKEGSGRFISCPF